MQNQTVNNSANYTVYRSEKDVHDFSPAGGYSAENSRMDVAPKRDGVRVCTAIIPKSSLFDGPPEEDNYESQATTFFQDRCAKFKTIHNKKALLQPALHKSKSCPESMMLNRVGIVQKVRIIKTLQPSQDSNKDSIRYKLEDLDEILDSYSVDDEAIDLQSLFFGVAEDHKSLNISIGESRKSRSATMTKDSQIGDGFELEKFSKLREKMFAVKFLKDQKESTALGKIEYKRFKHRIYDANDKLMFKVYRTKITNPMEQEISIIDQSKKQFCICTLKHTSPQSVQCEIQFPEACPPEKKVLIMSAVIAMIERVKPYTGKFVNDAEAAVQKPTFFQKLVAFNFFGCTKTAIV